MTPLRHVPDLPGCVATGATVAEVEAEIREAIVFHVEGLREDGIPIPAGASQVEYIEVAAQGFREPLMSHVGRHKTIVPPPRSMQHGLADAFAAARRLTQ